MILAHTVGMRIVSAAATVCLAVQLVDKPPADEYEFVPDTSRWMIVIQDKTRSIGKLDAAGNFVPEKASLREPISVWSVSGPPTIMLNAPAQKGVYEYRSGRLIKGDLDQHGNFVPEIGSKVIDFKDYHYSKDAPRIFNLPGRFVKKGSKEE